MMLQNETNLPQIEQLKYNIKQIEIFYKNVNETKMNNSNIISKNTILNYL